MKKTFLFLLFQFLILVQSFSQNTLSLKEDQPSPSATIEEVAWIAGHWQGEAFGGITEEIWSPPMGNAMMCVFRLVNDDKANFYEIVTITEENETLILRLKHFGPDLKGWEEKDETVDFRLVKLEKNKAFFNDLTFERISEDEMNIYVVISEKEGEQNEVKFPYKRVK